MTNKTKLVCCALVVAGALAARAQPFRNLGFEEANTNTTKFSVMPDIFLLGGQGPTSDLLPGWQLFKGLDPVLTTGLAVPGALGASGVVLYSKATGPELVEGNYLLSFGFNAEFQPWSLVQRGDIPSEAAFLTFKTLSSGIVIRPPRVTFDGKEVPVVQFPPFFGSDTLVFDVSPFAGQNEELRLIFDVNTSYRVIDDLRFVVPEPSTFALLGLVMAGLAVGGVSRGFKNR